MPAYKYEKLEGDRLISALRAECRGLRIELTAKDKEITELKERLARSHDVKCTRCGRVRGRQVIVISALCPDCASLLSKEFTSLRPPREGGHKMPKHDLKVGDKVESRKIDGTYEYAGTVTHIDGRRSVVTVKDSRRFSLIIESCRLRKIKDAVADIDHAADCPAKEESE